MEASSKFLFGRFYFSGSLSLSLSVLVFQGHFLVGQVSTVLSVFVVLPGVEKSAISYLLYSWLLITKSQVVGTDSIYVAWRVTQIMCI